ncbi:unnamed protein product [Phaedon cochleariae]|uniref:RING-type E3 ubiquitin transferase n=1 Tax=Phaedon cochleariae TaxID=80249 RepID=A0A9P0DJ42_PHACE|nr:unnamed protein product [Phaedon cochleariae]
MAGSYVSPFSSYDNVGDSENLHKKLLDFRCSICNKHLSVPPIDHLKNEGMRCGRCSYIPLELAERASIFERTAAEMSFPCSFKNCHEILRWGEVHMHEIICPKRDFECPFLCDKLNKSDEMLNHFMTEHHEKKLGSQWKIQVRTEDFSVFFFEHEGDLYVVRCFTSKQKAAFDVFTYATPMNSPMFELAITSSDAATATIMDQNVSCIRTFPTCWKCFMRSCQNKYHVGDLGGSGTNVANSFLRRMLGSAGRLSCELDIRVG